MPTLENARKVHEHLFRAELEGPWKHLGGVFNRSTWRASFPGGSWIQWVSAEQAAGNRGIRCDVVTSDEADGIDPELHDAIVVPWFSEPHSLGQEFLSGTPERGRYGLLYRSYRRGLDGMQGHAAFHATYEDVPKYVAREAWEYAQRTTEPGLFAREWRCDFDAAEGLVYPMFSPDVHVREPHPQTVWSEILVGVDHGYEDPGVFLVAGVIGSGRDAVVHVIEEVHARQQVLSFWVQKAKEIRQRYPQAKWFADPSQPAAIETLRRDAGVRIIGADNAIDDGVSALADRLAVRTREDGSRYARFYVSPRCKNLIQEFGLYRRKRDPRNRERVLDDIQDKDNHCADAARYLVFSRFGKPQATRIDEGAGWR